MGNVKDYMLTVEENTNDLHYLSAGLCSTCEHCRDAYGYDSENDFERAIQDGDVFDEGHFSYCECDACGTKLGGERYALHGYWLDDNGQPTILVHLEVCPDCQYFLEYGTILTD